MTVAVVRAKRPAQALAEEAAAWLTQASAGTRAPAPGGGGLEAVPRRGEMGGCAVRAAVHAPTKLNERVKCTRRRTMLMSLARI